MKQPDNVKWDNPGNEVIRRTEDNFQGRSDEIRIFHERTNWLRNNMHEDALVSNYWGFGGIGKTWLLRKLSVEAKNHDIKFISYEFDDSTASSDPAVVILYLASAIGKAYGGHIWDRTYALLEQYGADPSALEKDFGNITKLYDAGAGLVDTSLTVASVFIPGAAMLKTLNELNKKYNTIKSLRKNSVAIGEQLGGKDSVNSRLYSNEETLAKELADAFSADLRLLLDEQDKPLVIALDGLDRYYKYKVDDDWLKLIIKKSNDIHWVLAGRDALTWDDEIWKMEAGKDIPHLLPIAVSMLSKEDTDAYFLKAEVAKENHYEYLDYLYQLTDGIPLYMYLCVGIHVDLVNHGNEPSKEAFNIEISKDGKYKHHTKLIQRWAEDHADEIRELAAAFKWNDEVLKDSHISISPATKDWYALSRGKSIFQYDQKGNCSFHDVIQDVLMADALNKGMFGFMNHMQANAAYYMSSVKDVENATITEIGIDVLLYYLNLDNESWYTKEVDKSAILDSLTNYCDWLDDQGNWQYQLDLSERLLKVTEDNGRFTDSEHSIHYFLFANACFKMADYGKALEYYQKALGIREEALGLGHPSTATTYNNIGGVYVEMGDYGKALEYYQKALGIHEEALGLGHPSTATTYNNIGGVYKEMGDYGKALEYYQKALAISEEVLGLGHPSTAATYNNIGLVYDEMGDYGKALEYYQKALGIHEEVLGLGHPSTATTYNNIGLLAFNMGDYHTSVNHLFKAFDVYQRIFGKNNPNTRTISSNLLGVLNAYLEQGNSIMDLDKDVVLWVLIQIADGKGDA